MNGERDAPKAAPSVSLDLLEELARAATPGGWTHLGEARGTAVCAADGSVTICRSVTAANQCRADAAFIAAANPSTILALVEELRASRETVIAALAAVTAAVAYAQPDPCEVDVPRDDCMGDCQPCMRRTAKAMALDLALERWREKGGGR